MNMKMIETHIFNRWWHTMIGWARVRTRNAQHIRLINKSNGRMRNPFEISFDSVDSPIDTESLTNLYQYINAVGM